MTTGAAGRASFSVVIPAKDEAAVIDRCLSFMRALAPGEAEVVVVANGCNDETAVRAGQTPQVRVVEIAGGGKPAALNAGDAAVSAFPRIYLDADILISAETLRRLAGVLAADPAPAVAAPRPDFVTHDRPYAVRQYFAAFERLPYVRQGLVGLGVYAVNAAGRARFGAFPPLTNDDRYVQSRFSAEEVWVLTDETFQVQTPRTLRDLLKVRARVTFGNAEIAAAVDRGGKRTSAGTARALVRTTAHQPRLLPAAAVYLAVTAAGRARSRWSNGHWLRDSSTR